MPLSNVDGCPAAASGADWLRFRPNCILDHRRFWLLMRLLSLFDHVTALPYPVTSRGTIAEETLRVPHTQIQTTVVRPSVRALEQRG